MRRVSIAPGARAVVLPDGNAYDGPVDEQADPVEVVLTDEQFLRLSPAALAGGTPLLTDLGFESPGFDSDTGTWQTATT